MTDWRIVETRKREQRRFERSQESRDGWLHYGSQKRPLSAVHNTITNRIPDLSLQIATERVFHILSVKCLETGALWLGINHPTDIDQMAIDLHILLLKPRILLGRLLVSFFSRVAFQTWLVYCCGPASRSAISSVYCVTQGYLWTWSLFATASI